MTKSHLLPIFKCQYLVEILRYGSNFFACDHNFYRFEKNFLQGLTLIDFPHPPWVLYPLSDLGFKRVKQGTIILTSSIFTISNTK